MPGIPSLGLRTSRQSAGRRSPSPRRAGTLRDAGRGRAGRPRAGTSRYRSIGGTFGGRADAGRGRRFPDSDERTLQLRSRGSWTYGAPTLRHRGRHRSRPACHARMPIHLCSPRRPVFDEELAKIDTSEHARIAGVVPAGRVAGCFNAGEAVRGSCTSTYAGWRLNVEFARHGYGTERVTGLFDWPSLRGVAQPASHSGEHHPSPVKPSGGGASGRRLGGLGPLVHS